MMRFLPSAHSIALKTFTLGRKIMRRILLAFALLSYSVISIADNVGSPIMVGGDDDLDACASLGVVSGLAADGDGFLAVRSGANADYKLLDKLQNGQEVFVCNTSSDSKWFSIIYTKGQKDIDCGVASPISPAQPYQGKCSSGWVSKRWIKIIAG